MAHRYLLEEILEPTSSGSLSEPSQLDQWWKGGPSPHSSRRIFNGMNLYLPIGYHLLDCAICRLRLHLPITAHIVIRRCCRLIHNSPGLLQILRPALHRVYGHHPWNSVTQTKKIYLHLPLLTPRRPTILTTQQLVTTKRIPLRHMLHRRCLRMTIPPQ
jgi:hypothetical protein